ncbi:MAG TPA: cupin domain-containing protein [Nitrospiraceae bacterium]|nr:cupin domain-containing protein [Nitrospiraceae bacterium]
MIHRHVTEDVRNLALDYALGFLSAAEAAGFQVHVEAGCEVCAGEVRANRYLIELLPVQPASGESLRSLRDRLLALIEAEAGSIPAGWTIARGGEKGWTAGQGKTPSIKQLGPKDADASRLMLVRMQAGGVYPGFRAAGAVELYIVKGDLVINGEQLSAEDYCAAPGGTLLNDMESRTGCEFILLRPERGPEIDQEKGATSFNVIVVRALGGTWLPTPGPGVTVKPLFVDPVRRTETYLIRAQPGSRMPKHRHVTADQTLFLEGDGRIGTMLLEAGDFYRAEAGTVHEVSWTDGGCLCITFASIAEFAK